jgi:hypothetical protein
MRIGPLQALRARRPVAAWLLTAGVLLTACSTSHSAAPASSRRIHLPLGTGCQQSFDLEGVPDSSHSTHPAAAVAQFLTTGSMAPVGQPVANPVAEGFPATGWRQTETSNDRVTFTSNGSTLVVTRVRPGVWQVSSGHSTTC